MKLLDMLKKAFPKPRIPQKRYIILACVLIYFGLKLYVASTPSPHDDHIPEDFSTAVQIILSDNSTVQHADYQDDGNDIAFGERA